MIEADDDTFIGDTEENADNIDFKISSELELKINSSFERYKGEYVIYTKIN